MNIKITKVPNNGWTVNGMGVDTVHEVVDKTKDGSIFIINDPKGTGHCRVPKDYCAETTESVTAPEATAETGTEGDGGSEPTNPAADVAQGQGDGGNAS